MEEIVWIVVGVILIVFVSGSIISVVKKNRDQNVEVEIQQGLAALKNRCDFVCSSAYGTYLFANIDLPADSILYVTDKKICARFNEHLYCEICTCDLGNERTVVDLTDAGQYFTSHIYSCFFERLRGDNLGVECQG